MAPGEIRQDDPQRLHECGWSDEAIVVAVQTIGYFNYINRVAEGLGVDPEESMTDPTLPQWRQQKGRDYQQSLPREWRRSKNDEE